MSELGKKTSLMGERKKLRRIGGGGWKFWRAYCKPLGIDSYLEEVDFQTKTRIATGFVGRLLKGSHGRGKQVQVVIVRTALKGVNAKIALDTG